MKLSFKKVVACLMGLVLARTIVKIVKRRIKD